MQITVEQSYFLKKFTCKRLHNLNYSEQRKILSFECNKNPGLADTLKYEALSSDREGQIAYYVIVNNEIPDILMYFSLKCGSLFVPIQSEAEVDSKLQELNISLRLISMLQSGNSIEQNFANSILGKKYGFNKSAAEYYKIITEKLYDKKVLSKSIAEDKQNESNKTIVRVQKTYPAIELVHFCKNDKINDYWNNGLINRPMCEVFFWYFIAPIFFSIQGIVGCEYAFLFAADLSKQRSLISYYQDALNFSEQTEIGTNKPIYDLNCCFMCQKINDMKKNHTNYFENFNSDPQDFI